MAAKVKPKGQETIPISDEILPPSLAQDAVLLQSEPMPEGSETVQGYNWSVVSSNGEVDYHALLESYRTSGFQAMSFGLAVQQINEMARSIFNLHSFKCDYCVYSMHGTDTQQFNASA